MHDTVTALIGQKTELSKSDYKICITALLGYTPTDLEVDILFGKEYALPRDILKNVAKKNDDSIRDLELEAMEVFTVLDHDCFGESERSQIKLWGTSVNDIQSLMEEIHDEIVTPQNYIGIDQELLVTGDIEIGEFLTNTLDVQNEADMEVEDDIENGDYESCGLMIFVNGTWNMDKSPEKFRHRFATDDEPVVMDQSNDSYLACELKKRTAHPSVGCDIIFDSVLCWPQTPPNTLAVLPCFSQLNGIPYDITNNASRFCSPNGTWDQYTDYSNCKELMDEEHEDEITTKIYFIGYTISLVGLLIAVYIFCRFKDLRCLRNSIHMNLMISYILADFVWVLTYAIPISVSTKKTSCIFLVLLLHYFHLTNFFWMFIEGLYLYILVVKTFSGEHIKLRIYLIIGWGGPVLFVLFWGTAKSFAVPTDDQQSSGIRNCPWTYHVLDWIYQTPAMLLLVTNLIFLIVIMWVLITKLRSANNAETQQYRKAAKALLVLIPLLGVTHILVLVGPTHGLSKRIYEYVRAVLLSTQGFTVALFYCFLNMEVKNTLKHHFNSWHTTRSLGSRRSRYSSRDWSPRSRDSLRLYQGSFFKKRESTCSVGTTTTLVSVPVGGKTNSQQVRSPLLPSGDTG